jgi:hypothetical protein
MKTIFRDKKRPSIDEKGNLMIPTNIKFGGEASLKPREWFYLLYENTKDNKVGDLVRYKKSVYGSESTRRRIKKSLKQKGYL